jgi:hypothetical protein
MRHLAASKRLEAASTLPVNIGYSADTRQSYVRIVVLPYSIEKIAAN